MSDSAGGTRREGAATRRERARSGPTGQDGSGIGATRRDAGSPENGGHLTRRDGGGLQVSLSSDLAARFEVVEQRPGGGAEGFVFVCRDRDRDESLCALKVYGDGLAPDPEVHEALLRANDTDARVVRLHEVLDSGGLVVEVLEWAEHGSLDQLMGSAALAGAALVEPLWRAVSDFQRVVAGGHFDVKPANVLVRSIEPLDLVLGDLGLARVMHGSVRLSAQAGTIAYAPPEAGTGWGQVAKSPAWDWWSVGMIVAEAVLGRYALALPDGSMPSESDLALSAELQGRMRVDVSRITDGRLRALCAGLLTPDVGRRWSAADVEEWMDGGSPAVDDGVLMPGRQGPGRSVSVLFAETEYLDPEDLVAAFQQDWSRAQEMLFQARDRTLIDETVALARQWGCEGVDALLSATPTPQEVPRQMARLLLTLDPELHPVFDGVELSRAGLEAAAVDAGRDLDGAEGERWARRLDTIRRAQVLRIWRHVPGLDHAAELEGAWVSEAQVLDRLLAGISAAALRAPDAVAIQAGVELLLALLDREHGDRLADRAKALSWDDGHRPSWWTGLRSEIQRPAGAALAVATDPDSRAQAAQTRQQAKDQQRQRKAEEKVERDRQRVTDRRQRRRGLAAAARRARPLVGWASRVAVVVALVTEWRAAVDLDRLFVFGGPFFDWELSVLTLAVAAVLWKSEEASRIGRQLTGPAAVAAAYVFERSQPGSLTDVLDDPGSDLVLLARVGYALAAGLSLAYSGVDFVEARAVDAANEESEAVLWNRDRQLLRTTLFGTVTGVVPLVVGAIMLGRSLDGESPAGDLSLLFTASAIDIGIGSIARGVWFPLLAGAVLLVARGHPTRRPQGLLAAGGLALAAFVSWPLGQTIAEERLAAAVVVTETTPPPTSAVEDWRSCTRSWTGTRQPTRTYIGGDECNTLYHYRGWTISWTVSLDGEGQVDDLVAIDDAYIVLTSEPVAALAFDPMGGAELWRMPCSGAITIDEAQLDQGEQTSTSQRFVGTCSGRQFDLDPRTGR